MENKLLWELEQDFKNELNIGINKARYNEMTIKELLDLGFNNNYLETENYGTIELGWKDENGEYSCDFSDKELNVKVKMKEYNDYDDTDDNGYFVDYDGYHISRVHCVNKDDEKLFGEF